MGIEKEGTKSGGGYVGGFFQLFDWKSKSRKKLFAAKSEIPESSKHAKRVDGNFAMTRPYVVDEDETGLASSIRGSSDHSYASSVTDDEACGAKVPGVVARLMGLDSLPTSSVPDSYSTLSTPYFDTRSLQGTQYCRKYPNFQHSHENAYSGNMLEKVEGSSRTFMEPEPQKTVSRPIEKFQTEVLPPKSAKSIPVTHHKLLSPIKSPGFIPTNNAAYIMEAAARIIEPGPLACTKAKTPLIASSAVSLKVRDLKEKVEASQKGLNGSSSMNSRARDLREKRDVSNQTTRPIESSQRSVESSAARYLKGQSLNKSWNGSADTSAVSSTDVEEVSSLNDKGKSISLAIQAKVNVQRREGLTSTVGRNLMGSKEHLEVKPNQPLKTNVQKNLHKKSCSQNASGVLRQNNLKQNSSVDKDKLPSKPLASNSHARKVLSGDTSRHRSSSGKSSGKSKVGSRKSGIEMTDSEKEVSYTSTNNYPRKKRSTDKDWNDRVVDNMFIEKTKPIQSNLVSNSQFNGAEKVRKKDMDVVSFTFTTPLTKSSPVFETPGQAGQKTIGLSLDHRIKRGLLDSESTRSPVGYNVIGGDALAILLEQKLRELTYAVESSGHDSCKLRPPSSVASNSKDQLPSNNSFNLMPTLQLKDQNVLFADKLRSRRDYDIFSTGLPESTSKHKSWIVDEVEESRNHPLESQLSNCRHPSPVSVLEPSLSTESCESSSVSADATNSTEGSKLCSSVQAQEILGLNSSRKFLSTEADTELSDSASSSTGAIVKKSTSTFSFKKLGRSTWELDYVKDILCNVELMFMDFALGRAHDVVNPHLFNQLESRKGGFEIDDGESKIRRRVMFDCVSECLGLRCRRYAGGGYKMWAKGVAMVRKNELLAKEVYKEISGWGGMGDAMVDELVDKDMSSQYGRWLDFDVDAFELGAEVEDQILNSLVDEVLADVLQL